MLDLINFQFVRGINPNLAAGQRSIRSPSGDSPYAVCTIPNNAQFYNFGTNPFTIYLRYLDLGATRSYDQTGLVSKSSSGTGWQLIKQNAAGNIYFQIKTGGGVAAYVADNRPAPVDGFFHSICVTKAAPSAGQDASDVALIRLFVDGVEVLGSRTASGVVPTYFDNGNPVQIGGFDGYFLRGYIDVCSFYTVGLTDAEIAALDGPARTDRGAKFIQDFNQLSGVTAYDSSSVGQNGTIGFNQVDADGKGWVPNEGIRTFRRASTLKAPLNGDFTPAVRTRVKGMARFDADLTDAQYSPDGVQWITLTFDSNNIVVGLPPLDINPDGINPVLYLRATNANPSYLNALEIQY